MILVPDLYYTRRRTAHFVVDEHNEELFSAPTLEDVFEWLREQGVNKIEMKGRTYTYQLNIEFE